MIDRDLVLKSNELFLLRESPLDVTRARADGLYAHDTRYLSSIQVEVDGQTPELLATTVHHFAAATITSTNPALMLNGNTLLLPHQIAIEERLFLDSGLHVSYVLQNYVGMPIDIVFGLLFSADFRDLFEVRGFPRAARGTVLRPHAHEGAVHLRYRGLDDMVSGTTIVFDRVPQITLRQRSMDDRESLIALMPGQDEVHWDIAPEDMASVIAEFPVCLEPGERWELRISIKPEFGESLNPTSVPAVLGQSPANRATIITDNPFFNRLLSRCQDDLASLMTSFPHGDLPAAGIPWYVAPFGRDSLITGLQTFHLSPHDAAGTLRVLAELQGTKIDAFTEEQPGKILHEMRYGEMARSGEIPHRPYYGTVDATSLFVLLFAETVAWTADKRLYHDLLPNVSAALQWIEKFGDLDGDGMIEYWSDQTSPVKIRHQVWKDSHDSLHHPDGRQPSGNVTPVEVQGYTYAAYMRLAEVAAAFGDPTLAAELIAKAARLQERFDAAFWLEDEQFYAQALDGDKQPVRAISSNPGQLLFTGIAPTERAQAVVRRLQHPDLESGWGIRTLSSAAVSYNPMSYHNGSIWPHDNSLIAAGCYGIGAVGPGNAIFEALYDVGLRSAGERLNELYCGFSRGGSATDSPVPYPTACSPQAWAAGCYPYLVRSSLGLIADIGNNVLRVTPQLPAFFDEVAIRNMTVLGKTGSLTVRRVAGGYQIESEGLPLEIAQTEAIT